MKRSYFIFYVSAVAYCIHMLAALYIASLTSASLAFHESTVKKEYYHSIMIGFKCIATISQEHSGKYDTISVVQPDNGAYSLSDMSTGREWNKGVIAVKSEYHLEMVDFTLTHCSQTGVSSFTTSDQFNINPKDSNSLFAAVVIKECPKSNQNHTLDSKRMRGFNNIIEFPDKLS